ncbi:MAG: hypothetical protein P1S59_12785 [bacterium]|nr:hypothetical protein [bacterium]
MKRIKMNGTFKALGVLLAVAVMVCGLVVPQQASAALPAPAWMPGFPMLAGPQVILMWGPVPGAVKYNVYLNGKKATESPAMQSISPAPTEGGEYIYTVTAVDAAGAESPPSSEQKITIIKIEPPKSMIVRPSFDRIDIRWDPANGAVIYDLFRRVKGEKDWQMVSSITETRYQDAQVEAGVVYQYAVKSKDNTGKASTLSDLIEATLMVEAAADKGRKRLEFKVHSLPAKLNYRADLEQYPTDADICGNRLILSAHYLYIFDDITQGEILWEPEILIPNDKQFMGLAWDENCEMVYVNHAPTNQLWVVDPDAAGETRGAVVQKMDLPKPPDGSPDDEGTLYYISQDTSGKAVTIQKNAETRPSDVVIDADGNLVVGDLNNNRLIRLERDGTFIETILYEPGEELSNAPKWAINKPISLAVDKEGNIYAASINSIIQVTPDGEKYQIGGGGSIFGTFTSIKGVYISPQGRLYAADGRAGNIQVFEYHEEYKDAWQRGWLPVYIVTDESKKANVETLTPMMTLVSADQRKLIIVESMSKTLADYSLDWSKADKVELPPLEQ